MLSSLNGWVNMIVGWSHAGCSNQTDLYHPQEAAHQIWISAYSTQS
jgi:hypothetical protein